LVGPGVGAGVGAGVGGPPSGDGGGVGGTLSGASVVLPASPPPPPQPCKRSATAQLPNIAARYLFVLTMLSKCVQSSDQ
jgi:hypothetical protein